MLPQAESTATTSRLCKVVWKGSDPATAHSPGASSPTNAPATARAPLYQGCGTAGERRECN
eukprot:4129340-Alexandrium_andersonii.AAC.1